MTHYELLGVAPDATAADIRRAYLRAARRVHPDRPGGDEERMRSINQAWTVLSDPEARQDYDRSIGRGTVRQRANPTVVRPDARFRPHAAYRDRPDVDPEPVEQGDPATAIGAPLQIVPVGLWVVSLVVTCVGLVTGLLPVLALGVVLALLGGVGFLAAPLVAMGRAASVERAGADRPTEGRGAERDATTRRSGR